MGRKKYSKELKAQIALDAIKGQKTIAELAQRFLVMCKREAGNHLFLLFEPR